MPAGMSKPRYVAFVVVAMICTLAGAQTVHNIYRPLDDLDELVEKALEERLRERKKTLA